MEMKSNLILCKWIHLWCQHTAGENHCDLENMLLLTFHTTWLELIYVTIKLNPTYTLLEHTNNFQTDQQITLINIHHEQYHIMSSSSLDISLCHMSSCKACFLDNNVSVVGL